MKEAQMSELEVGKGYGMIVCTRCCGFGDMPEPVSFGLHVGRLRMQSKIGLREMSRSLGISPTHLSDIEKGKRGASVELRGKMESALAKGEGGGV